MIASYNDWFPVVGFNKPIVYKNEQTTLNVFENLTGYGIIHIYSHGWAWPNEKNIQEVYLLTGEANSINQNAKYLTELAVTKDIIIGTSKNGSKYYISPNFIASKNNFESDTTLIYGGFCYSYLGSWPKKMFNDEKAGGYFGFDWSVYTSKSTDWALDIFSEMTDTFKSEPMTVGDWLNSPYPKEYYYKYDKKDVHIKFNGYNDLALFKATTSNLPPIVDVQILSKLSVDMHVKIDTVEYDNHYDGFECVFNCIDVKLINKNTYYGEWDEERGDKGDHYKGEMTLEIDPSTKNLKYFEATQTITYYYGEIGRQKIVSKLIDFEGVEYPFTWRPLYYDMSAVTCNSIEIFEYYKGTDAINETVTRFSCDYNSTNPPLLQVVLDHF